MLLHATLGTGFSDAQCGFKAIRADRAKALLPLVQDTAWFFDTELLVLAERAGLRVHEVPVDWVDDPDSRVDLLATAVADLRGIGRLGFGLIRGTVAVPVLRDRAERPDRPASGDGGRHPGGVLGGQLIRFLVIGVVSTACYFLLYVLLRAVMTAEAANAVSLLTTAVANTAANRRITFGIRGRAHAVRHQVRGLLVFAAGLLLTSGALALLQAAAPNPSRLDELAVLLPANLLATLLRFAAYRGWVFRRGPRRVRKDRRARWAMPRSRHPAWPTPPGARDDHDRGTIPGRHQPGRGRQWPRAAGAARQRRRPGVGAAGACRSLAATAALYLVGLGRSGWANDSTRPPCRRNQKLEGHVLRVFRCVQFHHRGQAARVIVGQRGIRPHLRAELVEPAGTPGARGGRGGRAAVHDGPALVRPGAGLLAGAVLASTPVAALMFRFNNPDALLVLLIVAAAYAVTRAIEDGGTRWLVLAGSLVGFGFLTKMLQAFLVLPAFGIAYLVAGPPRLGRRVWQVTAGGLATLVAAGWWVAIVELTPASARPYIGGSTSNSVLQLTFGYNGLGRITGNETGSVGFGNGTGSPFGGAPRLTRLFGAEMGGQASWLIPAALIALAALSVVGAARAADRPHLCGHAGLGRLAAGDSGGVQLHGGDHSPLLHRGARARDRRPGGNRRRRGVACPRSPGSPRHARRGDRGERRLVVRAARPQPRLVSMAAWPRPGRRARRGDRAVRRGPADPSRRCGVAWGHPGRCGRRREPGTDRCARGPGGVQPRNRGDAARGRDPVGWARGDHGRRRTRWVRRPTGRGAGAAQNGPGGQGFTGSRGIPGGAVRRRVSRAASRARPVALAVQPPRAASRAVGWAVRRK